MAATPASRTLAIFNYQGKTFIGYICTFNGDANYPTFAGISVSEAKNYFIVQGPAEITYDLNVTANATADLVSRVMPCYPGPFMNGDVNSVYFAFPKTQVVFSSVQQSAIHTNIQNQYKQLTKLS